MAGWWWDRPEFIEAQKDPNYQAWVENVGLGIELYGLDDLIPGIPNNIYSDEALAIAEQVFLDRYPDIDALNSERTEKYRFVGYVGQFYVHNLEASWVNQPKVEKYSWGEATPALEFPWKNIALMGMVPIVRIAVYRRTGEEWSFLYKNNRKKYLQWKAGEIPDA